MGNRSSPARGRTGPGMSSLDGGRSPIPQVGRRRQYPPSRQQPRVEGEHWLSAHIIYEPFYELWHPHPEITDNLDALLDRCRQLNRDILGLQADGSGVNAKEKMHRRAGVAGADKRLTRNDPPDFALITGSGARCRLPVARAGGRAMTCSSGDRR